MAYVAQLLGYDLSVQSAAFDYLNAPSSVYASPYFSSNTATTISYTSYTDSTLLVKSPAGYYSDGAISRYYDGNETLSAATLCEYTSYVSGCCSQGLFKLNSNSLILVDSILNLNPANFCYIAVPTPKLQTNYNPLNDYVGFTILSPNSDCNDGTCQPCYTPPPPPPTPIPGITENNCGPITLLPLGVDCVTLVAPTPNYLYGSLTVNITGGTGPYTVTWEAPDGTISNGDTISNAPVGEYVVTVVDYWHDFTATTTCYLTGNLDCTFSGSVVDYTPQSPSPTSSYYNVQITGGTSPGNYSIYYDVIGNANYATNLDTGLPASGITLSLLNNNIGINVEVPDNLTMIILYNELCNTYQEFPVTPNKPINVCLCISIQETYTYTYNQIDVCYTGAELNGKPLYTNGTQSVSWNTNGYWELNGYADPNGSLIRSGDFDFYPNNNWFAVGPNSSSYTITTTDGVCVSSPPSPSFTAYGEEIPCDPKFGNIVANAIWGTPPWMYSLDGITYQNSTGIFTNVSVGLYTVYAMDSLGVVLSAPVTVPSYNQPQINLIVNTQYTQIASVGNMKYYKVDFTYDTTTLPIGETFNADYILNYNLSYTEPGSVTFDTLIHTLNVNGVPQTINNINSIPLSAVGGSFCNPIYGIYGGTEQYGSLSIPIMNSDIIDGSIVFGVDTETSGVLISPCITSAQVDIQASIGVTYPTNPTCYSVNTQQIIQTTNQIYSGIPAPILPSTPWSPSNIICNYNTLNITSLKGVGESIEASIHITNSGTRMYIVEYSSKLIKQYSIGIPHNISSTITYVGQSGVFTDFIRGLQLSSDGTKAYTFNSLGYGSNSYIKEYVLSNPFDISTISLTPITTLTYPTGLTHVPFAFNRTGTKIYSNYLNTSGDYYSIVWNLSTPYNLASAGSPITSNIDSTITNITGTFYLEQGSDALFNVTSNGIPQVATFKNGITNSDLLGTSNNCIYHIPDSTNNSYIYDNFRSASPPYTWTLVQRLTGI